MGLLCHGKKLLDMDNDELEDKEEGLCLQDDFLSSDEVAELIAKFTDASVHLCLYLDSCFDGDCPPGTVNAPSWWGHALAGYPHPGRMGRTASALGCSSRAAVNRNRTAVGPQ